MMRDNRVTMIFEGSSEIMRLFIMREALDPHLKIAGIALNSERPWGERLKSAWAGREILSLVVSGQWLPFGGRAPAGHAPAPGGHLSRVAALSRRLARTLFHQMVVRPEAGEAAGAARPAGRHRRRPLRHRGELRLRAEAAADGEPEARVFMLVDDFHAQAMMRIAAEFRRRRPQRRPARLRPGAARSSPVTQDRLHDAEAVFAELARGDDEVADTAAYMQARLYQVHFQQPDYVRAAALYRALAARHPASHWAQLGLVKLGLLELYTLPEPAAPAERIAAATALLGRIHEEKLQRDLHLQIAHAGTFYEQSLELVLAHLKEVDRIGGLVGQVPEDLAIELGELSLRAGHYADARRYFEAYLRDFTPNLRSVTVRRRLEDLAALEAKAKEGRP
jgi:hypothetical protein